MLIGAIVASFLAVALVAVLTATVIVNDNGDGGVRILRVAEPAPAQSPGTPLPGPRGGAVPLDELPQLRICLQKLGLGLPGATKLPGVRVGADALKACAALKPGMPALPTR